MLLKVDKYMNRIIDDRIKDNLKIFGAVCIEGPKWCGKTWTSMKHSNSVVFIGDPSGNFQNRSLAQLDPNLILKGEIPRLIDEWQEVPALWDAVRFEVDKRGERGQFILTGSSTPKTKGILHSGIGRINKIKMRTMSLYESGDSDGLVSLMDIFNNKIENTVTKNIEIKDLIGYVVRGGWPMAIGLPEEQYIQVAKSYIETIIKDDLEKLDGIRRNQNKVRALLKSLARNTSTIASDRVLINDIKEYEDEVVSKTSVEEYLDSFERMFIIENQPAFSNNYRSRERVAKTPKRHFIDPSLAVAALELTPTMLLNDLNLFGFLFESLVIRDLRIYSEFYGGKVFHYRHLDTSHELDAVVEFPDGRWIAIEIKLGANQIDAAAMSLLSFKQHYSNGKSDPTALVIICGLTSYSYQREDGVYVVPITSLKP